MTMQPVFDPAWLASLHARAAVAPRRPRLSLVAQGHLIGSLLADLHTDVPQFAAKEFHVLLQEKEQSGGTFWELQGDLTSSLNQLADLMRSTGVGRVAHYWRGEQLAVWSESGERLGSVERGAVRPLGIATRAVHLVGQTANGSIWVQQRSLTKANDPGQWDTLMGGMVSAQDDLQQALQRETWEEAGLQLHNLQHLAQRGRVQISCPSDDTRVDPLGLAFTQEVIDWFGCTVPDGVVPHNQDGEVAQFQLISHKDVADRLQRGEFTLEAALILVQLLGEK